MSSPSDSRAGTRSQWKVARTPAEAKQLQRELIMVWAKDAATGQPVYIHELGSSRHGAQSGCVCYGCEQPLKAINVGKLPGEYLQRFHFRHHDGVERGACMVLAARAAALRMFEETGMLTLPGRHRHASLPGFSGKVYTAERFRSPEAVRVVAMETHDALSAVLRLEDGRRVKVQLIGKANPGDVAAQYTDANLPTILVSVDDPAVAALSPEELRSRLEVHVADGHWCSHWADDELDQEARLGAAEEATVALDWSATTPEIDALPPLLRRESLLHIMAKEILAREGHMQLPLHRVQVEGSLPSGKLLKHEVVLPDWNCQMLDVTLEKPMGSIRPDVVGTIANEESWPQGQLLVEITVSNALTPERLAKIRCRGVAAVEVDLSQLAGTVNEAEFTRLLVNFTAGKRWIFHPEEASVRAKLQTRIDAAVDEFNAAKQAMEKARERRVRFRSTSDADWVRHTHESLRDLGALLRSEENPPQKEVAARLDLLQECLDALTEYGYTERLILAHEWEFIWMLMRLASIQDDTSVGYRMQTAWQVINTAYSEKAIHSIQWHTLYLLAIRVYQPTLTEEQQKRVDKWRAKVWSSLQEGRREYLRPLRFNVLLSILFPALAKDIMKPLPGATDLTNDELPHGLVGQEREDWKRAFPAAARVWFGV